MKLLEDKAVLINDPLDKPVSDFCPILNSGNIRITLIHILISNSN